MEQAYFAERNFCDLAKKYVKIVLKTLKICFHRFSKNCKITEISPTKIGNNKVTVTVI